MIAALWIAGLLVAIAAGIYIERARARPHEHAIDLLNDQHHRLLGACRVWLEDVNSTVALNALVAEFRRAAIGVGEPDLTSRYDVLANITPHPDRSPPVPVALLAQVDTTPTPPPLPVFAEDDTGEPSLDSIAQWTPPDEETPVPAWNDAANWIDHRDGRTVRPKRDDTADIPIHDTAATETEPVVVEPEPTVPPPAPSRRRTRAELRAAGMLRDAPEDDR